ncbi:hypothetical protein HNY73_002912 [Argiope bruennichi]|uniref:Uncharacterized protein n=1 Tax=Argiope bruennichi TaxID=94029 RepID=A0A8T0FZE8_ARGBR|nr:hypothetical protein HNY73_002912 [Argiope bruennichi]
MEFEGVTYYPREFEEKVKNIAIRPSLFEIEKYILTIEPFEEVTSLAFCTDGSKTELGTGCSYCAFENGIKVLEWKGKLQEFHTVFQAELLGRKMSIIRASEENETIKIWTYSFSSLLAVQDPHSPHQLARDISPSPLLLQIPNIPLRLIKTDSGYQEATSSYVIEL